MSTDAYRCDRDIVAWAKEQARLLRAGRFEALDIERIADEIEGVGKRELRNRMAVLLAHLLNRSMRHRVDVAVIHMRRIILVITDRMFPKPALPDS